jgi:hypothetical protein
MVINLTHSSFCFVVTTDTNMAETPGKKKLQSDDLPPKTIWTKNLQLTVIGR